MQTQTVQATAFTVKSLSDQWVQVIILVFPGISKYYWRTDHEVNDTLHWGTGEIMLTNEWKEIPSDLFKALLEAHQLKPYTVRSDEKFEYISVFTVHCPKV